MTPVFRAGEKHVNLGKCNYCIILETQALLLKHVVYSISDSLAGRFGWSNQSEKQKKSGSEIIGHNLTRR